MSLISQSDVNNDPSPHYRSKIHLCDPVSRPEATGSSVVETGAIRATSSPFAKDYLAEHTLAAIPATPTTNSTDSTESQAPETSKGARP
jgi:hypothetical protein